jgi:hypothetical protein
MDLGRSRGGDLMSRAKVTDERIWDKKETLRIGPFREINKDRAEKAKVPVELYVPAPNRDTVFRRQCPIKVL